MTIFLDVLPLSEPKLSTFFTMSKPGCNRKIMTFFFLFAACSLTLDDVAEDDVLAVEPVMCQT